MPATPTLSVGTVLKSEYQIERSLGRGGFGITYTALKLTTRTRLVIKEFFPDGLTTRGADEHVTAIAGSEDEYLRLKQRFRHEGETVSRLQGIGVPRWLDAWDERGTSYLALEYAEGLTLAERSQHGPPFSETEARTLLVALLSALEQIHAHQMLHADIKPANIVLTTTGPRLIDFGSALGFEPSRRVRLTSKLLTPNYAPLEQFGNDVRIGPQTDLYALAATIYHALTGTAPASSLERAAGAKLVPIRALNASVSPQLASVLERALELRVDARPASARAMIDQLSRPSVIDTGVRPIFWIGLTAALALTSIALTLGLPRLPWSRPADPGPRFACSSHSLKPWTDRSFVNQHFDVWFVPMDDEAFETLERVKAKLEAQLKIRSVVVPCFDPSPGRFDPIRRQFVAEQLIQALHTEYPVDVNVGSATTIAVSSESMYIQALDWRWAFAYRPDGQFGVVSTNHMRDGLGTNADPERFEARVRKMLMKNIGILHFKMAQTNDPTSVLFNNIRSVEALDHAQERF
jgi:serine/threonine-protein kinase